MKDEGMLEEDFRVGSDGEHLPVMDKDHHSLHDTGDYTDENIDVGFPRQTGSGRNSSGRSGDDEDDMFDMNDGRVTATLSSPTTSHHSPWEGEVESEHPDCEEDRDEIISVLPDEIIPPSLPQMSSPSSRSLRQPRGTRSPYTPTKQVSPFRQVSSVRAMQMDMSPPLSDPPQLYAVSVSSSPRHSVRPRLSNYSRHSTSTTPRSQTKRQQQQISPSKRGELPLVLLHVTLLPIRLPYPLELMTAVLPSYILENYKLLRDKVNETVLDRGILLPHPKEDYELLEERLLESLELKLPRILKCGHFNPPDDEEGDDAKDRRLSVNVDHSCHENDDDENAKDDPDMCDDCGRRVRDGRMGVGQGLRRWNIKIYAANGLMRAGAWAAAWKEMERVDVEIEPWIPEDMRRELEMRKEEEDEMAQALERDRSPPPPLGSSPPPGPATSSGDELDDQDHQTVRAHELDDPREARLREIYGDDDRARRRPERRMYGPVDDGVDYTDAYPIGGGSVTGSPRNHDHHDFETTKPDPTSDWSQSKRTRSTSPLKHKHPRHNRQDDPVRYPQDQPIPLSVLLRDYILALARDRRNITIAVLSVVVVLLSFPLSGSSSRRYSDEVLLSSFGSRPGELGGAGDASSSLALSAVEVVTTTMTVTAAAVTASSANDGHDHGASMQGSSSILCSSASSFSDPSSPSSSVDSFPAPSAFDAVHPPPPSRAEPAEPSSNPNQASEELPRQPSSLSISSANPPSLSSSSSLESSISSAEPSFPQSRLSSSTHESPLSSDEHQPVHDDADEEDAAAAAAVVSNVLQPGPMDGDSPLTSVGGDEDDIDAEGGTWS